jgi:hypothetical protein
MDFLILLMNLLSDRSYLMKVGTSSFLLAMILYYATILFHFQNPLKTLATSPTAIAGVSYILAVWLFATAGGGALRSGYVWYRTYKGAPLSLTIATVIFVSWYLFCFECLLVAFFSLSYYASTIIASNYYQTMRTYWIALALLVAIYLVYRGMDVNGFLKWQGLNDLKAIPFASPAFCFGLPLLIKGNMAPFTLDGGTFKRYAVLSFLSGVLFVSHIILYALFNHSVSSAIEKSSKNIEDSSDYEHYPPIVRFVLRKKEIDSDPPYVRRATRIAYLTFFAATYFLLVATIDLLVVIALPMIGN